MLSVVPGPAWTTRITPFIPRFVGTHFEHLRFHLPQQKAPGSLCPFCTYLTANPSGPNLNRSCSYTPSGSVFIIESFDVSAALQLGLYSKRPSQNLQRKYLITQIFSIGALVLFQMLFQAVVQKISSVLGDGGSTVPILSPDRIRSWDLHEHGSLAAT